MLVCRLNIWRSPTMGEKYTSPLSLSSGANSSLASLCGLLVIAPNRPQVVFLRASTVRSGSALPSLHQNSQPISQGTYSASSFMRSNTMRAASMTSWPTPSPGIHAILYLGIGCDFIDQRHHPQAAAAQITADYADVADQFWGAHAAGVLHSAARRMICVKALRSRTAINTRL